MNCTSCHASARTMKETLCHRCSATTSSKRRSYAPAPTRRAPTPRLSAFASAKAQYDEKSNQHHERSAQHLNRRL